MKYNLAWEAEISPADADASWGGMATDVDADGLGDAENCFV